MDFLIKFIGYVEYIDLSFVNFNLDDEIIQFHQLDAVRYVFGWQNQQIKSSSFYKWFALEKKFKNLRILDLSSSYSSSFLDEKMIEELDWISKCS